MSAIEDREYDRDQEFEDEDTNVWEEHGYHNESEYWNERI